MAEYKTFTCDIPGCGKKDAIHFTIPGVDHCIDLASGGRESVDGDVDLCRNHVDQLICWALVAFEHTEETRRKYWKSILGKG